MNRVFEDEIRGHHGKRDLKALNRDAGEEWAAWVG
jgi:hypothetical protein